MSFYFDGRRGSLVLGYEVYDADSVNEVQILINGTIVGYGSVTGDNLWGGSQVVVLPDGYVNDSTANVVTFKNSYNNYVWGVRNIALQ